MMMIQRKTMIDAEIGFLDALRERLNWSGIKTAVKERYGVDVYENVKYIDGALTAFEGKTAVRFDFDLEIRFSLFIGRDGNLLAITAPEGQALIPDTPAADPAFALDPQARAEISEAAVELAEIMKQING